MKNLEMCPFCGSIETIGGVCRWCNNKINDDYESEEQPMNVELRFTGLTPKLALRLIEVVNESGEQPGIDIPAPTRNIAPAAPAPMPAPAPVPMQNPAPYQMPAAPTSGMQFGAVPTAPAPAQSYQPAPVGAPAAAPTASPPQYDVEMLGRAAAPLAAAGKRQELFNLLQSFGVQSINELPRERYGEMAIALRGLGAQI